MKSTTIIAGSIVSAVVAVFVFGYGLWLAGEEGKRTVKYDVADCGQGQGCILCGPDTPMVILDPATEEVVVSRCVKHNQLDQFSIPEFQRDAQEYFFQNIVADGIVEPEEYHVLRDVKVLAKTVDCRAAKEKGERPEVTKCSEFDRTCVTTWPCGKGL